MHILHDFFTVRFDRIYDRILAGISRLFEARQFILLSIIAAYKNRTNEWLVSNGILLFNEIFKYM